MTEPRNKKNRSNSLRTFKRQHILAAARRIFDEEGMDGLNMRTIAKEAGYSLGAAYAYFRTKEEIELELVAGILSELTRHIKAVLMSGNISSNARLRAFSYFSDYFLEHLAERELLLFTLSGLGVETAKIPERVKKEFDGRLLTLMGLLANDLHQNSTASPEMAQEETMDFVVFLLGFLMFENGGRLKLLNQRPKEMVDRYGKRMLLRITQ